MSKVEEVARAIERETSRQLEDDKPELIDTLAIARAAIEALGEPTEAMIDAAVRDGRTNLPERATVGDAIRGEYRAAIKAALSEGES